ncbi:unnamed protein product [Somion occarium]|uniref:Uncharacterized protein n=1 Tax=Somion occarium TaxID=3059160 RepID=A0ABP1DRK2_9APHY
MLRPHSDVGIHPFAPTLSESDAKMSWVPGCIISLILANNLTPHSHSSLANIRLLYLPAICNVNSVVYINDISHSAYGYTLYVYECEPWSGTWRYKVRYQKVAPNSLSIVWSAPFFINHNWLTATSPVSQPVAYYVPS